MIDLLIYTMEIYGVLAVCIIVPILVMYTFYYLLKDLKFEDDPKPITKSSLKKRN